MNFKRLHTQSLKDVIDHTLVRNNPSLMCNGIKRLLTEVDDLLEFVQYCANLPCNCSQLQDNVECSACLAYRMFHGIEERQRP